MGDNKKKIHRKEYIIKMLEAGGLTLLFNVEFDIRIIY